MKPKHYPWLFVAFFAVIFIMNGIMVYFATTTFNGIAVEDAYEKGLNHNQSLAKAQAQKDQLVWLKDLSSFDKATNSYTIDVTAFKKKDALTNAKITVDVIRPTQEGFDKTIKLASNNGQYTGSFIPPLPGLWELRYKVNIPTQKELLHFRKRVDLRP